MDSSKMTAGQRFPDLAWKSVSGDDVAPSRSEGWRLLIVYRGKHCPLCKQYLDTLNGMLPDLNAEKIAVMTLSADPQEKAVAQVKETGWKFPVGYGLPVDEMRKLGLYVSDPRSPAETDRPFSEPGTFVINPEGNVQIIDISNAPFARPDLAALVKGVKFVRDKAYPVRGRA